MLAFVPITDRNLMQSNGRKPSFHCFGRQSIINYTTITLLYPLLPLFSSSCLHFAAGVWRWGESQVCGAQEVKNDKGFVDSITFGLYRSNMMNNNMISIFWKILWLFIESLKMRQLGWQFNRHGASAHHISGWPALSILDVRDWCCSWPEDQVQFTHVQRDVPRWRCIQWFFPFFLAVVVSQLLNFPRSSML
jgi:hypothetical protein